MKPSSNNLFIFFVIAIFLLFFSFFIYYAVVIGMDTDEKVSFGILSLAFSSLMGIMFFIPVHLHFLKSDKYTFYTAISNYFLMLLESSIMILGFTLSDYEAGSYSQWFFILVYIFFGFHMFSYPLTLKKSLYMLAAPIGYVILSILDKGTNSYLQAIISAAAEAGYVFTFSLIIAGLYTFVNFWYRARKNLIRPDEQVENRKTLYIPLILYAVFIFIPGMWYLLPGIGNYFSFSSSIYLLLVSIIYFIFILLQKVRTLGTELVDFMGGRKEVKTEEDEATN